MSATPEREQAEALSDAREFLSWNEEQRAGDYHEHLGDAYREMARVYRAFVAAVERAEKAERRANHHREEYDLIRAEASRKIEAAVERERELTRALADVCTNLEEAAKGWNEDNPYERAAARGREALAGGVSAAGQPEQDLGGNAVAVAEAGETEQLLHDALLLLTPGKWGREHGYDVPTDAAWTAARIHLMRLAGRDDLADHLYEDEMSVLSALDWNAGNTARADALNEALAALTTGTMRLPGGFISQPLHREAGALTADFGKPLGTTEAALKPPNQEVDPVVPAAPEVLPEETRP